MLFFCLLLVGTSFAQLIQNQMGQAFTELPFFHPDTIQRHGIKQFKGKYNVKKMRQPMVETTFELIYTFDDRGRITQSFDTREIGTIRDTSIVFYGYHPDNLLAMIRSKDWLGFVSQHFAYFPNGTRKSTEIHRDVDSSHTVTIPEIYQENILHRETYGYDTIDNRIIRTTYNQHDQAFIRDEYLLENGRYKSLERILLRTSERQFQQWFYDEQGRLVRTVFEAPNTPVSNWEKKYVYDHLGNVKEIHSYKNGVYLNEISVIYNYMTGLLSSILFHDQTTHVISIVRIENYVYH